MPKRDRKLNRWPDYDYSLAGMYFVTFCSKQRGDVFGVIENGKMRCNVLGGISDDCFRAIPAHYHGVDLDEFAVMPDHVHGIIVIHPGGSVIKSQFVGTAQCAVPTVPTGRNAAHTRYGLLSKIIKSFKESVVKTARQQGVGAGFAWQRSFHDRVIRSDAELENMRKYIRDNPLRWKISPDS
jgi:REP element-mobilizing transposase RayT